MATIVEFSARAGRYLARQAFGLRPATRASSQFVSSAPSGQHAIDLFAGEWSSKIPGYSSGKAELFNDPRISWMDSILGVRGKNIIELGPLEAGHTFMMSEMGAGHITAIEGNTRAFQKCLCVKEVLGIKNARFLLGDFIEYLQGDPAVYDLAVACGVLYHMADPLRLLSLLASRSDRVFIWTHYYEAAALKGHEGEKLFSGLTPLLSNGRRYDGARKAYASDSMVWKGFSGGPDRYATWLTRQSLLGFFEDAGFSVETNFDEPNHPNGPAIALCATRLRPLGM